MQPLNASTENVKLRKENQFVLGQNNALREENDRHKVIQVEATRINKELLERIANLEARDTHTCHADCARNECMNGRLRELLELAYAWMKSMGPSSGMTVEEADLVERIYAALGPTPECVCSETRSKNCPVHCGEGGK